MVQLTGCNFNNFTFKLAWIQPISLVDYWKEFLSSKFQTKLCSGLISGRNKSKLSKPAYFFEVGIVNQATLLSGNWLVWQLKLSPLVPTQNFATTYFQTRLF